jgi:hypothetical protein
MEYINNEILGKFMRCRPVLISDAEFIVKLRTDPHRSKHISKTASSITKQQEWISAYLDRWHRKEEFYFIVQDLQGLNCGTLRIYNILENECTAGSWVMQLGTSPAVSLESYLAGLFFPICVLIKPIVHIDVRASNKRVWSWHESCGAVFTHEDSENRYYYYNKESYETAKQRVYMLLGK